MSETHALIGLIAGIGIIVVGQLWLLIAAFRVRILWGLAVLFLPVLGAVAFIVSHFRRSVVPLILVLAGGGVIGGTILASHLYGTHVERKPWDKDVNGERHLTITGWDETDYSILKDRSDVVVLQMANADVTDQTLEFLKDMDRLRELDLNFTQVTDEGLRTLAQLPQLQTLRLRKTKVTDEGFRENLLAKDSLLELDLRETKVASKTLREWKDRNSDKRKFLR